MRLEFYGCLTGRLKQTTDENKSQSFHDHNHVMYKLTLSRLDCSVLSYVSRTMSSLDVARDVAIANCYSSSGNAVDFLCVTL